MLFYHPGATTACNYCVGGTTGRNPDFDCANKCAYLEANKIIILNGKDVCVPTNATNMTLCDGTVDSGAIKNE